MPICSLISAPGYPHGNNMLLKSNKASASLLEEWRGYTERARCGAGRVGGAGAGGGGGRCMKIPGPEEEFYDHPVSTSVVGFFQVERREVLL